MTELDDPADAVAGLVERLRQDADMLKDGYQRNLTELWHGVVVKDAAKACAAAADLLEFRPKRSVTLRQNGLPWISLTDRSASYSAGKAGVVLPPKSG